jgi:prefoldin beta subunit
VANELNQTIQEFERTRAQLMGVSSQKNQLKAQSEALESSVEELNKTKEEKVFKAAGNILVQVNQKDALKEVKEQKESIDLRLKTVEKQETTLLDKLNKLKTEIESAQKGPGTNATNTNPAT